MRRYSLTALALCGLLSASSMVSPMTVYGAYDRDASGVYRMTDGTAIENVYARGIDVSHWKQQIDWNAVAADDVSFVMLGTRYKGEVDPYFRTNAEGAHKAGIALGAYIYSYATTPEMAVEEADFVLDLIKDYPISYPVAFDVEDNGTLGALTPGQVSDIINAFCERIADAGYYPMVYANDNWLANKIDLGAIDYDIWVARYGKFPDYEDPAMWQATSSGEISGVEGNTDIDFQFHDFSGVIPDSLWRTIDGVTYFYKDYTMQKNTWAQDGESSYFFDENGQTKKGWFLSGSQHYYLDETTGKMQTGWLQLDGSWYYFASTGQMETGWNQVDSAWYYLAQDGKMQTGWLTDGGNVYYLNSSGAMSTGWVQADGFWYFFGPAGDRQSGWIQPDGSWYFLAQDGKMQTGWLEEGGSRYYLSPSGVMKTGWIQPDGNWYFLNGSGEMKTGWICPDGNWYYLGKDGKMQTGLVNVNEKWYWLESDGRMAEGRVTIDGKDYYFDSAAGGAMAAGQDVTIDGAVYRAGADGVLTPVENQEATDGETTAPESAPAESAGDQAQSEAGTTTPSGQGAGTAQAHPESSGSQTAPDSQNTGSQSAGPGAMIS